MRLAKTSLHCTISKGTILSYLKDEQNQIK